MKFHTAFDERWRQVATFRGSDSSPKEQFVYHCAGNGGWGGSSYIDSVFLRDRDMTNGWTGAADGTLEERIYLLQNWRADVVALVEPDGDGGATMVEWIKYSAYGVPFGLPAGDTDSDGDCDSTDDAQVTTWKNAPAYDVRGDLNLDGVIDADDETLVVSAHQSLGRGVLTSTSVGNRKGYAGYEGDAKLIAKWHVRHRVLDSVIGRWLRRDPLGYVDGLGLAVCSRSAVVRLVDPTGLKAPQFADSCAQAMHDCLLKHSFTYQCIYTEMGAMAGNSTVGSKPPSSPPAGGTNVDLDSSGAVTGDSTSAYNAGTAENFGHEVAHARNAQQNAGRNLTDDEWDAEEADAQANGEAIGDEAGKECDGICRDWSIWGSLTYLIYLATKGE